jgi:Asp-tRNA(Asn)/Glu-tRNA(Gln) amidotransferase A subunit family amidase
MIISALRSAGHDVREVSPPSPYEGLVLASQLLNADGCETFSSQFRTFEKNDPGAAQLAFYMRLPRFVKYIHYLWVKYIRRDAIWAGLLRDWQPKSSNEHWQLVVKRETYKSKWLDWWNAEDIDVILSPPNATPALPHGAMHDAVSSCGYTFLFNLVSEQIIQSRNKSANALIQLDYSAGVIPVTKVDPQLDRLPSGFSIKKLNGVAQGAYKYYDALKMAGLPVGIQVVGRRLEEEKVLTVMERIEQALEVDGQKYELLNILD